VKTIFFPADVWLGVATIIRQTPNHLRPSVAEFFRVLHSDIGSADPMYDFMDELIRRD
jgi:hypothetical protein